ncbi:MAG: hypothetical protein AB2688_16705 [Candidatus Thiodiazotropha taylori]|nr:hypothetical protein [Candidatus Thiodiazotropha taylori]MCG8056965.1 hypothetical protein [Candidatus Thiodiazotropha taylori]MCW4318798.1 hypothetical protein [Candidatus Thiodiazotropha taylori]MCW4320608.1 hypothetical protein [Candidatus Thiodiazotropha taylori]
MDRAITSLKESHFADAIVVTGDLLKQPIAEDSQKLLTVVERYLKDFQKLGILPDNGSPEQIIQSL